MNCSVLISPEFTFCSFSSNSMVMFGDLSTAGIYFRRLRPSSVEMYWFLSSFTNFLPTRFWMIPAEVAGVPILYFSISFMMFPGLYRAGGFVLSAFRLTVSMSSPIPSDMSGRLSPASFPLSVLSAGFNSLYTCLYPSSFTTVPDVLKILSPACDRISVVSYS